MDDTILNFNYPTDTPKIIKVIGVGGGGGNAVTHMYKELGGIPNGRASRLNNNRIRSRKEILHSYG